MGSTITAKNVRGTRVVRASGRITDHRSMSLSINDILDDYDYTLTDPSEWLPVSEPGASLR